METGVLQCRVLPTLTPYSLTALKEKTKLEVKVGMMFMSVKSLSQRRCVETC